MKLCLHDVTLLAATSVDIEETHQALLYSAQQINFGAIKLLSPIPPQAQQPSHNLRTGTTIQSYKL